jgi:DNA helicase-2/ATP-dependent DNA helicase PcrA
MEQAENPSLSEFLQQVSLVADIDSVDPDGDYVLLMTLHSAKGLEFDYVYMTGMEENTFPSYMAVSGEDSEELEEERRLCYVGITRARKELTMTAAQMRMVRGEPQFLRASRFVREIPRELIELEGETTDTRNFMKPPEVSMDRIIKFGTGGAGERLRKLRKQPRPFRARTVRKSLLPEPVPVQKADHLDYKEGDRVRHVKFGDGTVQDIKDGGKDYEVTVDFDTCGVKRMFASFAKLKKI